MFLFGSYLITFREVLEAALVVAIILAYLSRTAWNPYKKYVWYGVYGAVAASVVLGFAVWAIYGAISKQNQVLFEAIAAFVATAVLSSMIYWMSVKGGHVKEEIEQKMQTITVERGVALSLGVFAFIVVAREGIETVLFLTPFLVQDAASTILGFAIGLVTTLILSYGMFKLGMTINLRRFFSFTSILLVILAGGLVGYGVHEFVEYLQLAKVGTGWLGNPAYVLNIPADSVWHHKGLIGSVFSVMFGYTVKAEWARVLAHGLYLVVALPLIMRTYRKRATPVSP